VRLVSAVVTAWIEDLAFPSMVVGPPSELRIGGVRRKLGLGLDEPGLVVLVWRFGG
jgi:hypothetical protein